MDNDNLKAIVDELKNISDTKTRAEKLKEYISQGVITFNDLSQLELNDIISEGDFFKRRTTFEKESDYNEVIAVEEYTLEGSSSKVLAVSTNEWGDIVGYKERGANGTSRSVENLIGSNRTVEMGPMMHHTMGKAGKYRSEFENRQDGTSKRRNSYEYDLPERTVQIEDVMVSKDGERACKRMVNGVPSFMATMKDNEITLVQYTKDGEELASYRYDATTGLPKDYDPNIGGYRTYPGIEKFEFDDKDYIFEDVISNPSLQRRLLTPEEYKTISEMDQVDFKPSKRLDKLKERLGVDTKFGNKEKDMNKDRDNANMEI